MLRTLGFASQDYSWFTFFNKAKLQNCQLLNLQLKYTILFSIVKLGGGFSHEENDIAGITIYCLGNVLYHCGHRQE